LKNKVCIKLITICTSLELTPAMQHLLQGKISM
jgi:hypothetical protein